MATGKTLIGIDLGATNVRAGLVRDNNLQDISSTRIKADGTVDEIMQQIYEVVDEVITDDVESIGMGVPSVVDVEKGIVYDVQNIDSWDEVPVGEFFKKRYNLPIYVNNDANCFVLGEKYFGKAEGYRDIVGLIIGTGFAGGLILNNKLYAGPNCGAGEFGMIPYKDSIYEHYSCGQFFERQFEMSGEEVHKEALKGDEKAKQILKEYGSHLGNAIKAVLYAVDPEIIVLGGSVRKAFEFFKDSMWEEIQSFAYSNSLKNLKIEVSERDHIALLGAAALHMDAIQ